MPILFIFYQIFAQIASLFTNANKSFNKYALVYLLWVGISGVTKVLAEEEES